MSDQPLSAPHLSLEDLRARADQFKALQLEGESLLADPRTQAEDRADCELMLVHVRRALAEVYRAIGQRL